jgi:hypothetical protein
MFRSFRSSCLQGLFLILFQVGAAHAIGSTDSKSTDLFWDSRDQIVKWASRFVAKKRNSVTGFVKPEAPLGGTYHYVNERTVFGKTAKNEECALHLGRRLESREWVFSFYLENQRREVGSVSMMHENLGLGDGAVLFEGSIVVQSQPTVSNIGGVTSLDLHTTASSMSLLSIEVSKSGILGEESLSILLDNEDNMIELTYRFINNIRVRDGRRIDPVTCYVNHVS